MAYPDKQDNPSERLATEKKVGIGFWLLWLIGLCLFIVGTGCSLFGLAFFIESIRRSFDPAVLALVLPTGALVLLAYVLIQAFKKQKQGTSTPELLAYVIWLPLLAVFLWGGGCLLSINAL